MSGNGGAPAPRPKLLISTLPSDIRKKGLYLCVVRVIEGVNEVNVLAKLMCEPEVFANELAEATGHKIHLVQGEEDERP